MSGVFAEPGRRALLFCLLVWGFSIGRCPQADFCRAAAGVWDSARYISIDEIKPGMEAYCLTGYKGVKIERFGLEVLSVVRNWRPGRDAILVQGTDERFIHTGPVAGASGSPVYIDGRLAGALAFAAHFSKDPFYIATPIGEMLSVGRRTEDGRRRTEDGHLTSDIRPQTSDFVGYAFDFSVPIDFAEIDRQMSDSRPEPEQCGASIERLPCPLVTSGLPAGVCEQLGEQVSRFGFMAVSGSGAGAVLAEGRAEDVRLVPGACLAVPLVTGDIAIEAIGTVTEVEGDKIYGLGHSFLGIGPIDLPMATGQVHTVVSSVFRSFKFASAVEIVGALRIDESTAVLGRIGAEAKMIPLTIRVERYNDTEQRVYNCRVANNRLLTPLLLRYSIAGAALELGSLPPDHTIEYKVRIGVVGAEDRGQKTEDRRQRTEDGHRTSDIRLLTFENVSTGLGLSEMLAESVGAVAILLNNPYERVDIRAIDIDVCVAAKNISSKIWSVVLSDSTVRAGDELEIDVVVESTRRQKKKYRCSLRIPEQLAAGRYDLIVCGGYDYEKFVRKQVPYRFVPQSLPTLLEALNNVLAIGRDKLYCLLVLPSSGVAVERAELPDLPATKILVLGDAKRTLRAQPYSHWLEEALRVGTVVSDKKVMHITVEE